LCKLQIQQKSKYVISTEINHIIWLSTAEEIDILYLSAISYCACEAEGKYTMNM
jgi:hypothetical protein